MFKNKDKQEKGFTLIELLVVISIISLLSSVVLVSVQDARNKAKYTKFAQEMNQLILALELYKNDNSGAIPKSGGYIEIRKSNDLVSVIPHGNLQDTDADDLLQYISAYPEPPFNNYSYAIFLDYSSLVCNNLHPGGYNPPTPPPGSISSGKFITLLGTYY